MNVKNNNKLISRILSQIIYDIKTSNILIKEYANKPDKENVILKQIFFIEKIIESTSDYLYIKSKKTKLIKSSENLSILIKEALDESQMLLSSKKLKVNTNTRYFDDLVYIDRKKVLNSIYSLFIYIYLSSKVGSKVKIEYDIIDYKEDLALFFDKKKLKDKFAKVDIKFNGEDIPNDIKKYITKKPIIKYKNTMTNNIYLYNLASIIKKHKGSFWYKNENNLHNIVILLPFKV